MSKEWMNTEKSQRAVTKQNMFSVCLLGFGLLLASPGLFACSCAAFPTDETKAVAMAYGRADVIFLGTVTAVNSKRIQPLSVRDSTFDVLASWKGLHNRDTTVVRSAIGEIACGFEFRRRGRYLVFANWDADRGILWTNICELTRKESEAQGLIKELNDRKQHEETDFDVTDEGGADSM